MARDSRAATRHLRSVEASKRRVAVGPTMPGLAAAVEGEAAARLRLVAFRKGLYQCPQSRGDALFELADVVLTAPGRVGSLAEFSEVTAFRRGHGALYDALACGTVDTRALRGLLAGAWGGRMTDR